MLTIQNKYKAIQSTNFWETEYNAKGFFYLSFNAGCFRLLVPGSKLEFMPEMRTAKKVLIACGQSAQHDRKMLRLLFEDYSDSPYVVDLSTEQADVILKSSKEKKLDFYLYAPSGKVFEKPCEWCKVDNIDNWFGE